MTETQEAYALFISLPSGCAFSWTGQEAAFNDPLDAAKFAAEFPGWTVLGEER